MIFDSEYCFANISATKAWIFIKFETYTHMIVVNSHNNFGKDSWTHTRAQGVNARTCHEMHARAFLTRVCMCMHGSSPNILTMSLKHPVVTYEGCIRS